MGSSHPDIVNVQYYREKISKKVHSSRDTDLNNRTSSDQNWMIVGIECYFQAVITSIRFFMQNINDYTLKETQWYGTNQKG